MRIFVPLEVSDLQSEEISPRLVHYVSEKLAAVFPDADAEGLEYVATLAAADDSLRKMSADGAKGFRRIVGVAEVKIPCLLMLSMMQLCLSLGFILCSRLM
ncbi:DUF6912 family protein [Arcanobacterium hippocoleae]|uniref:DUF6912 family protein n=1 Tax=Arcanobacterium hippocoleae TaxID=149017 RepID=UPI00333EF33D